MIKFYQKKIYHEIESCCLEILDLLQEQLIPSAKDVDARVFYLKMIADYNRYLAEIITGDEYVIFHITIIDRNKLLIRHMKLMKKLLKRLRV